MSCKTDTVTGKRTDGTCAGARGPGGRGTPIPAAVEEWLRLVEEAAARQEAEGNAAAAATPHPALRATFPSRGRHEGTDNAAAAAGTRTEADPSAGMSAEEMAARCAVLRVCREQIALTKYVRKVFQEENLIVEEARLEKYLGLGKYFGFELFPWERFVLALWLCVYKAPGLPRWRSLFCLVGRGAGKDGLIAFTAFAAVSPYNPVPGYDVDICANDEEQAMRPVRDVLEVLEEPRRMAKLRKHYYHTKELIQGRKNRGIIKGRTNNPKHRDGMRSGLIVFNEIHAYENYDNIKVFRTGLGKKEEPREGHFTSNGSVSDGPLDDLIDRGKRILFGGEPDNGFLPFICRLPDEAAVRDPANWSMANPSLPWLPTLRQETADEFLDWRERPEEHADFLTKRMNLRKGFLEIAVTDYEKVRATNRQLPDLRGWRCVVGVDFAELSDFAAVTAHFRRGEERFDICKTFICTKSKTLPRVKAPWRDWAELPVLIGGEPIREFGNVVEVVDDVSIGARRIAEFIRQLCAVFNVRMLAMDAFRLSAMGEELQKVGFDVNDRSRVKLVRPSDVMQADPVIQECFDRELFSWGDNPCLRWAVNNTKRIRRGKKDGTDTGNYYYGKIEAKSRKTDPFMALVAAVCCEKALGTGEAAALPQLGAIKI